MNGRRAVSTSAATRTPRPSRCDGVREGAAEGVAGVDRRRRRVLLRHVDRQRPIGGGLLERLELGGELLDGQLHLVDAVLHDEHLVDRCGLLEEADEPPLDGAVVTQPGLQVHVLGGDVLAGRGHVLNVTELGEALDGGLEELLRDADDERRVGIAQRGGGCARRAAVGGHGRVVERHGLDRSAAAALAAQGARHDVATHGRRHGLHAVDGGKQRAAADEQREVAGAEQVVGRRRRCRRDGRGVVLALGRPSGRTLARRAGVGSHHRLGDARRSGLVGRPRGVHARAAAAAAAPAAGDERDGREQHEHGDERQRRRDHDLELASHGFLLLGRAPAAGWADLWP